MPSHPQIAIIGAGALGSVLARRLVDCGYTVGAIISRKKADAEALAVAVGAPVFGAALPLIPAETGLLFCCVPDDALPTLAADLSRLDQDWAGRIVVHTSGALPADVLSPLADQGASLLSFHPVQTFTRHTVPHVFEGIALGLEGDPSAVETGIRIAHDLGARPFTIPRGGKPRYHLAACMASNFAVTLAAAVREVLSTIGIIGPEAVALLHPLVEATLRNLQTQPPEEALTGPIARGDVQTVESHLAALREHLPHLTPFYEALARETLRLADRRGRLPEASSAAFKAFLGEDRGR